MPNGIPITIIGNLTADPDIRYTTSGAAPDQRGNHENGLVQGR